jgi:thiol-disulfide isomerase/thioredoxin
MSVAEAPAIPWLESLEEATRQARETGKPIFLEFFSPTCGGCQAMDSVTYPDHEVQQFLRDHFTPVRLDVHRAWDAVRRYNQNWTPTLLWLNSDGVEEHRVVGYLPPEEFGAELELGLAKASIDREEWDHAQIHLHDAVTRFPETWAAAEAQYWMGVVRYKAEGKPDGLLAEWNVLMERWPESRWARSASFIRIDREGVSK